MIGINKTIFEHYIENRHLYETNSDVVLIEEFIASGAGQEDYRNRQGMALRLIDNVLEPHNKTMMSNQLAMLGRLEEANNPYGYNARDHVIHAVLTYLLGVYLSDTLKIPINMFQWKLAALLHDIGYPLEKMRHQCRGIELEINRYAHDADFKNVSFNRKIENLDKLYGNRNSFYFLSRRLSKWGFNLSSKKLFDSYAEKELDHGIASSLILIKCLDALYHNNNPRNKTYSLKADRFWSYDNFTNDIIESATSIFLHNLKAGTLINKLSNDLCPLAFLLRLSDELQDWERLDQDQDYHSAGEYDISYNTDLNTIKISVPENRLKRIRDAVGVFDGFTFNVVPVQV